MDHCFILNIRGCKRGRQMRCLVVDDDREFSYQLSTYIDNLFKGYF